MGMVRWVRHGQASFGAADYDRLSPVGQAQCEALGAHWRATGWRPSRVWRGALVRHAQSLAAIERGLGEALPPAEVTARLNEYDSHALLEAHHPGPLPRPDTREAYALHFRLLREALTRWAAAEIEPAGMPTHAGFVAGLQAVLDAMRDPSPSAQVLVVSSGGPIAHACGLVLGAAVPVVIDLNMRLRNSAVTEMAMTARRLMLASFNTLPHVDEARRPDLVTHA